MGNCYPGEFLAAGVTWPYVRVTAVSLTPSPCEANVQPRTPCLLVSSAPSLRSFCLIFACVKPSLRLFPLSPSRNRSAEQPIEGSQRSAFSLVCSFFILLFPRIPPYPSMHVQDCHLPYDRPPYGPAPVQTFTAAFSSVRRSPRRPAVCPGQEPSSRWKSPPATSSSPCQAI